MKFVLHSYGLHDQKNQIRILKNKRAKNELVP